MREVRNPSPESVAATLGGEVQAGCMHPLRAGSCGPLPERHEFVPIVQNRCVASAEGQALLGRSVAPAPRRNAAAVRRTVEQTVEKRSEQGQLVCSNKR